ncbi:hypothetical protein HOLDEFILI_02719 [Holdemania filiformis DSM 12042]|uniref:Transmembrane protein n=1 Tax=Holdemania filiformis DSM 12042 TaxID=545696 RepID=B9YA62_9FIRM|nr:hypothetical protein HOLDEFILI_02719 [Holdemania filiformis DSM 12042]
MVRRRNKRRKTRVSTRGGKVAPPLFSKFVNLRFIALLCGFCCNLMIMRL